LQVKSEKTRFSIAFAASIVVHILLASFISLNHQDKPLPKKESPQFMDVVLLDPETTPQKNTPKDAKTISNRSASGGSSSAKDRTTRTAKAPVPSQQKSKQAPTPPQAPITPPPAPPKASDKKTRILTKEGAEQADSIRTEKLIAKKETVTKLKPTPPRLLSMSNLMPSSQALSQLSRDFQREKRMKQLLSKEADIPINTKEAKYAPYARDLVRTLEEQWRPGKADYKKFSERSRQVLMRVTIELSGELGNLEILRPSPIPTLNESAIQAIHDAAPFKPLPSSWGLDRASFYFTFEVIDDQVVFRSL